MMNDLPTPEELGEKLKAGEITREQAIEVMSERARREAFSRLYSDTRTASPETPAQTDPAEAGSKRYGMWLFGGVLLGSILVYLVLKAIR